jgi:hypothetical protein
LERHERVELAGGVGGEDAGGVGGIFVGGGGGEDDGSPVGVRRVERRPGRR